MAKYVKLTAKTGAVAWVNLHSVATMIEEKASTAIYFPGGETPVNVKEKPDQILQLPFTNV
jgi:hypothetical protein